MDIEMFIAANTSDLAYKCSLTHLGPIPGCETISHFLGGLDSWEVTKDEFAGLPTVRFEIENTTDLASGTRLPWNPSREGFIDISLEDYLANPSAYNKGGSSVIDPAIIDYSLYSMVSVLSPKIS